MNTKQVIIFRKDLLKGEKGIRKGKFGAQCAHASLCAFLSWFEMKKSRAIEGGVYEPDQQFFEMNYKEPIGENEDEGIYDNWTNGIYTKVVLGAENEEELMKVYHAFQSIEMFPIGIPMALITDVGKTEFHGKETITCLGVGPYLSEELDKVTKEMFNLKPL